MTATFADIVGSGPLLLALGVALLAGLVSFFAPCMLPLVPGYLYYVTGLAGSDLPSATGVADGPPTHHGTPGRRRRGPAVGGAVLFVLGFTAVFVVLSAAFGALGRALLIHARTIEMGGRRAHHPARTRLPGHHPRLRPDLASAAAAPGRAGRRPDPGSGLRVVVDPVPVTDVDRSTQPGRRARLRRPRCGARRRIQHRPRPALHRVRRRFQPPARCRRRAAPPTAPGSPVSAGYSSSPSAPHCSPAPGRTSSTGSGRPSGRVRSASDPALRRPGQTGVSAEFLTTVHDWTWRLRRRP